MNKYLLMKEKTVVIAAAVFEAAPVAFVEPAVQAKLGGATGLEAVELVVFVAAAVVRTMPTLQVSPTTFSGQNNHHIHRRPNATASHSLIFLTLLSPVTLL